MNVFFRMVIVLFALFAFLPGYVLAGDKTLKIDPRHVVGFQDMRSEITSMLEILGYEQLPLRDPSTGQPVSWQKNTGITGCCSGRLIMALCKSRCIFV